MKNKYMAMMIFILFEIISFIKSKDYEVELDNKEKVLSFNEESELLILTIKYLIKVPNYIKLEIQGSEDINYVLSIFSDEKREKRIQLAQSTFKKTILFLTRKQFESNSNKVYAEIECSSKPCSYNLTINSSEKIILEEGEQIYYYVTEYTKDMEFLINLKSEKVNIWSLGGKDIKNTLDSDDIILSQKNNNFLEEYENKVLDSNSYIHSKKGNYYLFINKEKIEFNLTGSNGDYINVGSLGYIGNNSNKPIIPDEETFIVFLERKAFPKACFDFRMREVTNKSYTVFLEGIIFNKYLEIFQNKNGEEINNEVLYGKFSKYFNSKNLKENKLCFSFPKEEKYNKIDEIKFSFYITLGKTSLKGLNIYYPQINGVIYSRSLRINQMTAYIGLEPYNDFSEINYNIFNEIGFTKLYIYDCENYPLCLHDNPTNLKVINPRNIDRFSTYSIYKKDLKNEYNPIGKKQKLMMAMCVPSMAIDLFCSFNTLIYSDIDEINMDENQYINQYLLEKESDKFKIIATQELFIKKIIIDIIVYVGEVEISNNSTEGVEISKHNSANKFFINLKINNDSQIIDDIRFKIIAKKNSYYSIVYYSIRKEEDSEITNEIHSGMNYLITIDPLIKINEENANKYLNIINDKFERLETFIINFYSLNCNLEIMAKTKIEEEKYFDIEKYDYCYEDIISKSDKYERDSERIYNYIIKIKEDDFSSYDGKLCMLYVSANDLTERYKEYGGDIVIPDNTPQQIIFNNNVKHITFGYVHVNKDDDVIAKLNLIHKAEYFVKFFYENIEGKNYTINSNNAIFLNHSEWETICYIEGELCYIIIDITLKSTKDIDDPILEFAIKSVKGDTPIYLPKNIFKLDYVQNKASQHYFTEVGINEKGFILVNFYRNTGKVFAKLMEINPKDEKYGDFPNNKDDSLPYDSITKKIHFNTNEKNCQNGCYLLINIQPNSEKSSIDQFRNYPFTIIISSSQINSYQDIPPMRIPIDEYIIGDIKATENEIKDYYSVRLNKNADKIIIDLQSHSANLFVNIGNEKPNLSEYHFKIIPKGKDIIYTITKEEIMKILENKENIKDIFLTIGVWSDINDSINSTIYSFMIHLEDKTEEIFHRVKSDRKTLCDTKEIKSSDSKYSHRCLFVVEYFLLGELNNLLLYPILHDMTADYKIYGEYIEPSIFEMDSYSIEDIIPSKNSEFSTDKTNLNYLYIRKGLTEGKYLILNIVSTKKTRIELISTFYTYLDLINPNPNTPQLFLVKKNKPLILDFPNDNSLMVNFISITGDAEVFWQEMPENKYYLLQDDYRISLTSIKNSNSQLVVKSLDKDNVEDIGFAFYLTYNARYEHNFDEIIFGKSTIFHYSPGDYPIVFYSRLEDLEKDVEIFFTFYNLDKNNIENFDNETPIKASAILVKEKTVYNIKSNSEITIDLSKSVQFKYEHTLRTGFLRLRKDQLKNFNINQNENPNLYIKLEKINNNESFKRISVEISANQENNLIPISEKMYQHGIILGDENRKQYILKTVVNHPILVLEFSSLSDEVSLKLENDLGEDIEKQSQKSSNGKYILFFKINPEKYTFVKLIIFKNSSTKNNNMFTFKYINIIDIKSFIEYTIEDDNINIIRKKNNYQIELLPIKDYINYNVNYYVKICNNQNKYIPKQSIAMDECDNQLVKHFSNPNPEYGKLIFEFYNVGIIPTYIQVKAHIYDKGINEFMSYKIYEYKESDSNSNEEEDDDDDDDDKIIALIIVLVIFFLIIIGLIITLFLFNKKSKNLLKEVNSISFADNDLLGREN